MEHPIGQPCKPHAYIDKPSFNELDYQIANIRQKAEPQELAALQIIHLFRLLKKQDKESNKESVNYDSATKANIFSTTQ